MALTLMETPALAKTVRANSMRIKPPLKTGKGIRLIAANFPATRPITNTNERVDADLTSWEISNGPEEKGCSGPFTNWGNPNAKECRAPDGPIRFAANKISANGPLAAI